MSTQKNMCSLQKLRINSQGYTPEGFYYGVGQPVYWYSVEYHDDRGWIDYIDRVAIRANDREHAKQIIRKSLPNVKFYR